MSKSLKVLSLGAVLFGLAPTVAAIADNEQFLPHLVYRTGPYAVNGAPWANGVEDYWKLINERDGGINGVKIKFEECEDGYSTDKGVECYERLKGRGAAGAGYVSPLSTGMTFAFTAKAPQDKIPILTPGYGRSEMQDGAVFAWNFPVGATHWGAADIAVQYIAKELGGASKLAGKKIAYLYNDSPYGKDPLALLEARAKALGFQLLPIPVTHPGVEQKSQWLTIRREKPDYVILWGWGVMNSTSIQEAAAVQYPVDRIVGTYWSASEADVSPAGDKAKGFKGLVLNPTGRFPVHVDVLKNLYAKGKGTAKEDEVGTVLYNRGLVNSMIGVEAIRTAQSKFGKKPLSGEEIRWGLEHLDLTAARIKELGFEGMVQPIKLSCADHAGSQTARIQQWDGQKWQIVSDWFTADTSVLDPLIKQASAKYAADAGVAKRDCLVEN